MEVKNENTTPKTIPNDVDKEQKGINVPNLRFKEEKWISVKNHQLFSIASEKNKNNLVVNVLSASQEKGMIPRNEIGIDISFDKNSISNYKIVNIGDYVVHLRSFQGGFAFSKQEGICSPAYTILRPNLKYLSSSFFESYFTSQKFINSLKLVTYGIRDGRSIAVDEWLNMSTYIPSREIQDKIINFIENLNLRINTQSKIIEDLKVQKKYICNKIFHNKSDSLITLKHILKERIEKSIVNNQYEPLSSTVKGLFTQKEYFDGERSVLSNVGYKVVHLNDIILSPQNLWMGNITLNQRFERGIVSPSYKTYIINSDYDCYYIFNMLKTNRAIYKYIMCSEQGASVVRRNLNIDDFLDLKFNIPNIETQKRMGNIIKLMDEKILIEQNVLEKLKEQKKYLLSNMFI